MHRGSGCWLGLVLIVGRLGAAEVPARPVQDIWNAAYLNGNHAGFVRTQTRELERGGQKILRTTSELHLTVQRFQDVVTLRMETGSDETPAGKVVGVSMRQFLGQQQSLVMTGTVTGNQLRLKITGRPDEKTVPWREDVIGLYGQERLFQERRVQPGDTFTYRTFEPMYAAVITYRVTVKGSEDVDVLQDNKQKATKRLLRADIVADKIEGVQLPALASWLDEEGRVVRSAFEMPPLGKVVLYRTTRANAEARGVLGKLTEIGRAQMLRLSRPLPRGLDTVTAVYRITVKGDDDPATAFKQDGRQTVRNLRGATFELHVRSPRGPQPVDDPTKTAPAEFLQSNTFVTSADPLVQKHARAAVGSETDPWKKALLVERWVREHMKAVRFDEAFATADEVARTLTGDCTEHAVLAAAMCRAVGVPSRLALGLVYVPPAAGGSPSLAFHMWFEVWVRGQWLPLDATLGRGFVGATHLKITDHSWHNTPSLTPLLPVMRVMGKTGIDLVPDTAPASPGPRR